MRKNWFYLFLAINLFIIFWFWWQGSGILFRTSMSSAFLAIGRLMGLLSVFFVLLQLLMIGRTGWLEKNFGLDRLSRLHHLNGTFLITFIIAHPIFLALGYSANTGLGFFSQILDFIRNFEDVLAAAIGLFLFLFVVGYSLYLVRARVKYEWWYFSHLFTYLAIALAFSHQLGLGGDFAGNALFTYYWYLLYAFVLASLAFYRIFLPLWNFKNFRFYVKEVKAENEKVTSVYISGKNMEKFKIQAGQFMIVRFLQKGFWWQAHPFSLSAAPNGQTLRLTIKNVGDYTSTIKLLKPGTKIIIEGPYGIFTENFSKSDKILLIAGGIGITPIRALAEQISKNGKKAALIYGNKTFKDIVFLDELNNLSKSASLPVFHVLSQETNPNFKHGHIDLDKIKEAVPDFQQRDIYLCGPKGFMESLVNAFLKAGILPDKIHFENFSL